MNKFASQSYYFLPILILSTAPLEKLSWKIGFTLRPVMILSFIAFFLWLIKSLVTAFAVSREVRQLLTVFFLMTMTFLLASINSLEPVISMRHTTLYFTLFLLAFIMIDFIKDINKLALFVKVWMAIGVVMCTYGLLQFVGPFYGFDVDKVFFGLLYSQPETFSLQRIINPGVRSYSLFGDANNFAGYLTTVLPFFICSLFSYNKSGNWRLKLLLWFFAIFVLVSLILTLSRSGGLGLMAIFGVILILKRRILLRLTGMKFWVAGILIVFLLVWQFGAIIIPLIEKRLTETGSAKIHLFVAESAIKLFLMSPLTGVGLGNFGPAYGKFFNPGYEYYNAHSTFLTILSETGIIGFVLYMSFYGFVLKQIIKFRKHSRGYNKEVIGDGLLTAFIGLMAANIFYQNFTYQFFWVFLALGFAAGTLVRNSTSIPVKYV